MKNNIFAPQNNIVKGKIKLNGSKSISNRVLIIEALSGKKIKIDNLSEADDTQTLKALLKSGKKKLNAGAGGTTFRFLTAFLACQEGRKVELTGSERMQQRPIKILVDALNQLGADITYLKEDGFPPLKIKGKKLVGGSITIPADTSSQYISALLMIAPTLEKGLVLTLEGEIMSKPYIQMTINLMNQFGAKASFEKQTITVEPGAYTAKKFFVEADWSAASYFYEIAALAEYSIIRIKGLQENSLQGDAVISEIMSDFGIETTFLKNEIQIKKIAEVEKLKWSYDFIQCPDLAQTMITLCAAKNINAQLKGLSTLLIKETDRVAALNTELSKYNAGLVFNPVKNNWLLEASDFKAIPDGESPIETYDDHRMAMAFAPLCLVTEQIIIDDPMVVTKSYPDFWKDLEVLGFIVYPE